ncbi:MAG: DUF5815 family protein [Halobacteriaceae archaeon]
MVEPGVPGGGDRRLDLPCGESLDPIEDLDMGMREVACDCGDRHAVVMDVHPPSRFLPERVVEALRATVEPAEGDAFERFSTAHMLGMVMEEFPDEVASADLAEEGAAGYALVWVTSFDARRLHEVVVELVVEMMEHAVGHADDGEARSEFEEEMAAFDVSTFVDTYRGQRDFDDEYDSPA